MFNIYSLIIVVLSWFFMCTHVFAEDHMYEDIDYEMPIVLSASRLLTKLTESPAPVTVIDREMIEASPARNINELLRMVPGFIVGSRDGRISMVTNHGIGDEVARRFQVLIDGRSVYTPSGGGVVWVDLNIALENIERIEAIRGPNAATYGANSFLGVVNIITKHTSETTGTLLKGEVGTEDYRRGLIRHGQVKGKLGYRVTLQHQQDDGFEFDNEPTDFDGKKYDKLNIRMDYQIDHRDMLETSFGFTKGKIKDGLIEPSELDPYREQDESSDFQFIKWSRNYDIDNAFKISLYHKYESSDDEFDVSIPPFPTTTFNRDIDTHRWSLEYEHKKRFNESLRTAWGGEIRHDKVRGEAFLNDPDWQTNKMKRVFGRAEWRAHKNWLFNTGATYEDFDIGGSNISPMLAVIYLIDENSSIRSSVSRAYRYPVTYEEEADLIILDIFQLAKSDGGLDPGKITTYEVAYTKYGANNAWSFEARLFHDSLDDLAMPFDDDGVMNFHNSDSVDMKGIELHGDWRLPNQKTRLIGSYAYILNDATDIDENLSDSSPRHNLGLMAIHHFDNRFSISTQYSYISDMEFVTQDPVPDVRKLDMKMIKIIPLNATSSMKLSLSALNLLNDHTDFRPVNDRDRQYYFDLSLSF